MIIILKGLYVMKKMVFNVLICFFVIFLCANRSNATINTGCGLADYKAVYQNSSAFSRFQIRWDSKSYKSIAIKIYTTLYNKIEI